MQEKLRTFWASQKKILVFCLIAAILWGLFAHGYTMFHFQLSHDSLDGLYAAGRENAHKIELGRVLAPAYRYLFRGMLTMPWMIGLLGFFWIGLGVWLMADVLGIQSRFQLGLICGLMTVNLTITALSGTFMHDLDQNTFAMMLACFAVFVWHRRPRGWLMYGMLACAVCLGIYQAFISVAIGLIMHVLLMQLLRGEKAWPVLRRGLEGAVMVVLGGALFLLLVKGITQSTGVPLANRGNSLSAMENLTLASIPGLLKGMYRNWWEYLLDMPNTWMEPHTAGMINRALIVFAGAVLVPLTILRRDLGWVEKAFILLISLLFPLGWNVCYLLTSGFVHHLMQYAFMLFYVLCLQLATHLSERGVWPKLYRPVQYVCFLLVALILWSGVQTANAYHFKKNSTVLATDARMTAVYSDMLAAGYVPGETPLVVKGEVPIDTPDGFEETNKIWPGNYPNAITGDIKSIRSYFRFVLGDDAVFLPDEQWYAAMEDLYVQSMPVYPDEGYIDYLDDVMIVNLS